MTPEEREQVEQGATVFGRPWFQHQLECFQTWQGQDLQRMLVHYPTGKGKTTTMLMCMALRGVREVLVITPPITQPAWVADGAKLGIEVTPISHAKFRGDYRVSRDQAVIVDEFHLLGGVDGKGFKKLDRMAAGMRGPLILGSATPNYNDAERCYCLSHVLDPMANRGGYLAWLFKHCTLENDPFSRTPKVTGFIKYGSDKDAAAKFLEAQRGVVYLPDEAPDIIVDIPMGCALPDEFEKYNLDISRMRLMASMMEIRQRRRFLQIVDPASGRLRDHVWDQLETLVGNAQGPTLIFAARSTVAGILADQLHENKVPFGYIDGTTPTAQKVSQVKRFIAGELEVLVGTASMATGTDGIDKVCDQLIILDDTDDASLRRQLVGRILPRGDSADYSKKRAPRFVYDS